MKAEDVLVKNNLLRILFFLIALYSVSTHLLNENLVYCSVYIASMVVCILVLWVGKHKFGIDKLLYLKAYIFTGWLIVTLTVVMIVGWNDSRAISNGSLVGIVFGLLFHSNEFRSNNKDVKMD